MLDWFESPLINYTKLAPMHSQIFEHMSKWIESVDKAMEEEFGEFYDSFYRTVNNTSFKKINERVNKTMNKTIDSPQISEESKRPEIKDSKSEEKENNTTQYYTCVMRMYSSSDGKQHIIEEEIDSTTGKRKVVETKRIGDKSYTVHTVTDKEGKTEKHETIKNMDSKDVEFFNKEWESNKETQPEKLPVTDKKNETVSM